MRLIPVALVALLLAVPATAAANHPATPADTATSFAALDTGLTRTAAATGAPLYPDLQTLPPRDLRYDIADTSAGAGRNVLRFTNTVWNAGEGPLVIGGDVPAGTTSAPATQSVEHDDGTRDDYNVGSYLIHPEHQHFHYDGWGRYELWTKAAFDSWIAAGRPANVGPDLIGAKTTSCVLDEEFISTRPSTPFPRVYQDVGCDPTRSGKIASGLSVGWGDTYDYDRFEQWIDLGSSRLADGTYVLRSITDPANKVYESPGKADAAREGQLANEAMTTFVVSGGVIGDTDRPSGTVTVNDVSATTSTSNVTVRLLGRDDVSGVGTVRISNDGVTWRELAYGGSGSAPMSVAWDLADARYGGTTQQGLRTVYAQFRDRSGKWSASETDTIQWGTGGGPGGPSSLYTEAVMGDDPLGYWRLSETTGSTATDQTGRFNGSYTGSMTRGVAGLLNSDVDKAVRIDGASATSVNVAESAALQVRDSFALEAWIKPESLPAAGSFRSVLTRPESYSLQFNGPRLEFTVIQNGSRRRVQAPAGAIVAGQAYHVAGTYDGQQARLYVNGAQVAALNLTGLADLGPGELHIGTWDGWGEVFTGTIDEAAVYPLFLTGLQVKQHYDAGVATAVGVSTPTGLTATATSTSQINLAWTDTSNNETGFVVERSTSSAFTSPVVTNLPAGATTSSQTGLAAGTTYFFRVKAVNATDSSAYSGPASATTQTATTPPPAAPAGVTATAASPTRVDVRWTDASSDETGFEVQRSTTAAFTTPATLTAAAGATTVADTGVAASTGYFYRVRSVRGTSVSAWVDATPAPVTTPATPPPAAPAGVTATAASSTRVDVRWTDASSDETGFEVQRSTTAAFTTPATLTAAAGATTVADTGVAASTGYFYRVRSVRGTSVSAWVDATPAPVTTPAGPTTPPAGYASTVAADGPVSHWRLAETTGTAANDVRGVNRGTFRNGILLGAVSLIAGDSADRAVRADGTNDWVDVPDSASLDLTTAVTLEAWIRPDAIPTAGNWASVATKAESYALQFNGPQLEFTVMQNGSRRRLLAPAGTIVAGQTYHVVGTYDGATQRLYVNGSQIGSRAQTGAMTVGTWPLSIASWGGWGEYFRGTVDEVAVYNKVLTATRIAAHSSAGRTTAVAASARRVARTGSAKARTTALGPAQRLTAGLKGPGAAARKRACASAAAKARTRTAKARRTVAARACRALGRRG